MIRELLSVILRREAITTKSLARLTQYDPRITFSDSAQGGHYNKSLARLTPG